MFTSNKITALFTMLTLAFSISSAWASDFAFSDAPQVKEQTETTATIEWNEIPWVFGYMPYWSTEEITWDILETTVDYMAADNLVTDTLDYKIENLEAGVNYFVYVTAFDEEGNETPLSPALELSLEGNTASSLSLDTVEVNSANSVTAVFNKELSILENSARDFILEDPLGNVIYTESTELASSNSVRINFEEAMQAGIDYKLIVIEITDIDGKNIEDGVDWETTFKTPETFPQENEAEVINNMPEETETQVEEEPTEVVEPEVIEPAVTQEETVEETTVAEDEGTEVEKVQAEELPTTWPTEMLILFMALIAAYFVVARKKA